MRAEAVRAVAAGLVAALAAGLGAQGAPAAGTVAPMSRFAGTWYQLSAYGAWGQSGCLSDTSINIATRAPEEAELLIRCWTASGIATRRGRLRAPGEDGAWRTRFGPALFAWLPVAWSDFWVIGHDEGLTWFVAGGHDQQRLAIYARTIALDEAAMAQALVLVRREGFDVARLVRTAQDPIRSRDAR